MAKKTMTPEEKQAFKERMAKARAKKQGVKPVETKDKPTLRGRF